MSARTPVDRLRWHASELARARKHLRAGNVRKAETIVLGVEDRLRAECSEAMMQEGMPS